MICIYLSGVVVIRKMVMRINFSKSAKNLYHEIYGKQLIEEIITIVLVQTVSINNFYV